MGNKQLGKGKEGEAGKEGDTRGNELDSGKGKIQPISFEENMETRAEGMAGSILTGIMGMSNSQKMSSSQRMQTSQIGNAIDLNRLTVIR